MPVISVHRPVGDRTADRGNGDLLDHGGAAGDRRATAKSPASALKALESRDFDLALIDLNYARDTTSGREGLDLLSRLQTLDAALPVVVMTAWASVDLAVEAMRRGAKDFVAKPWENPRLLAIVRNQIELGGVVGVAVGGAVDVQANV